VRKKGEYLALYDVLRWVTQQTPANCRKMWQRLAEMHPELVAICHQLKFNERGRGCHQETPAIDAKGVVQVLMALPGPAAVQFRLKAADVLVRYLGGDETLAAEVWTNRQAQQALAALQPEHPARLFGEAVEREGAAGALASTPQAEALEEEVECLQRRLLEVQIEASQAQARREDAEAKYLHLQSVAQAFQLCEQQGFTANPRYEGLAREAVNAAMLPPGQSPNGALDAAGYLEMRGHTPAEIARMAGEFGKALKLARVTLQGQAAPTTTQDWGPEEREIFQYRRQEDREFLAAVYTEFTRRPLYQRVVQATPALQQQVHLALEGTRGMPGRPCKRPRAA
jgi:hypothetical protein